MREKPHFSGHLEDANRIVPPNCGIRQIGLTFLKKG